MTDYWHGLVLYFQLVAPEMKLVAILGVIATLGLILVLALNDEKERDNEE